MSDTLDDILGGDAPEPVVPVAAAEPIAAPPAETVAAAPEPVVDPIAEPPEGPHVPVAVVQAVRTERNDWKEKAIRFEEQLATLKRDFEAAKAAPPPAVPAPAPTIPQVAFPNPVEDPVGYAAALQQHNDNYLFNGMLNMSEAALRRAMNDDADVDEKINAFKEASAKNPAMGAQLRQERDPYGWAYKQGQKQLAMREIGDDPTSYRTKLETELRAKWEAERGAAAPAAPAAAAPLSLPQSLATQRSAGPRAIAAWTGPPSLDDILGKK